MPHLFRNKDVPDSQPCIYQLSIRAPGQAFSEIATFSFSISPSALRVDRSAMSSFSETQGPVATQGVTRVVDSYGLSPPVFTIEGTTGWDRHLSDGYILTGLQSIQLLQKFLARYAELNQLQRQRGRKDLYALEFYDYFSSSFWQVEPVGPQIFRQGSDRPLLTYYRLRWAAVKSVGMPILGTIDAMASTFATPAVQAAVHAVRTTGAMLVAYAPVGAVDSTLGAF